MSVPSSTQSDSKWLLNGGICIRQRFSTFFISWHSEKELKCSRHTKNVLMINKAHCTCMGITCSNDPHLQHNPSAALGCHKCYHACALNGVCVCARAGVAGLVQAACTNLQRWQLGHTSPASAKFGWRRAISGWGEDRMGRAGWEACQPREHLLLGCTTWPWFAC